MSPPPDSALLPAHLDFSRTLAAISTTLDLLRCSHCRGPPGHSTTHLNRCGHSLCLECAGPRPWSGDKCPVSECGVQGPSSEREPDRKRLERWEALVKMQIALSGDNEDETKANSSMEVETSHAGVTGKTPRSAKRNGKVDKGVRAVEGPKKKSAEIGGDRRKVAAKLNSVPVTKQKSNLNKKNAKGETALQVACIKGDTDKVTDLLDKGASPNTQDNAGWTPLHEASQRGNSVVVRLLLEHGALPNVPGGSENTTPLHDAATCGCAEVVRLLIRFGAKKRSVNAAGATARDLASNEETRKAIDETSCDMTETQQLETSLLNLTSTSQTENIVILFCGMKADILSQTRKEMRRLPCKVESKLTGEVTHVVYDCEGTKMLEDGDKVFYQALLMGKWILDLTWYLKSRDEDRFEDESDFVLLGTMANPLGAPSRAHLNHLQQLPRLFDGFHVYLQGTFSSPYPRRSDLAEILRSGGASLLSREPDPEFIPESERKVPYHIRRESPLANCSHYILYQEEHVRQPMVMYDMPHIKSLPISWLFECVDNFKIVDPRK